jgi:hypothetical protein
MKVLAEGVQEREDRLEQLDPLVLKVTLVLLDQLEWVTEQLVQPVPQVLAIRVFQVKPEVQD